MSDVLYGSLPTSNEIKGTLATEEKMSGNLAMVFGKDGKSAYELAVENGFEGTEEEWLDSLGTAGNLKDGDYKDSLKQSSAESVDAEGATALGVGTKATNKGETVVGRYNAPKEGSLFTIGNGVDTTNRNNIQTVYEDGTIEHGYYNNHYAPGCLVLGVGSTAGTKYFNIIEAPLLQNGNTYSDANGWYAIKLDGIGGLTENDIDRYVSIALGDPFAGNHFDVFCPIKAIDPDNNIIKVEYYVDEYYWKDLGLKSGVMWIPSRPNLGTTAWLNAGALGLNANGAAPMSLAVGRETISAGMYSLAGGNKTVAGYGSLSVGEESVATGKCSLASGVKNSAWGSGATASGIETIAKGDASSTEGYHTQAKAYFSHAGGDESRVEPYATCGFVHGKDLIANKPYQTFFGTHNYVNDDILFGIGNGTHPANDRSNAFSVDKNGNASIKSTLNAENVYAKEIINSKNADVKWLNVTEMAKVQGLTIKANGVKGRGDSFAMGPYCEANGVYSHVGGNSSKANSSYSFAYGENVTADSPFQAVFGKYNTPDTDALFIIGCGSNNGRANVLTVKKNGNVEIIGDLQINGKKVLTDADKQEIASMVSNMISIPSAISLDDYAKTEDIPDVSNFVTEEQVLQLIQSNMPINGDEESY